MTREFIYNNQRIPVQFEMTPSGVCIVLNRNKYVFSTKDSGNGCIVLNGADESYHLRTARDRDHIWVWLNGNVFVFQVPGSDHQESTQGAASGDDIRAPMPGTLVKLFVAPGDAVEERQVVAIVEAMKMEHQLRSPRRGIVELVSGIEGETVDAGLVIVSLSQEVNP
jgi:biotin carboxyl carrier protein